MSTFQISICRYVYINQYMHIHVYWNLQRICKSDSLRGNISLIGVCVICLNAVPIGSQWSHYNIGYYFSNNCCLAFLSLPSFRFSSLQSFYCNQWQCIYSIACRSEMVFYPLPVSKYFICLYKFSSDTVRYFNYYRRKCSCGEEATLIIWYVDETWQVSGSFW